MKIYQHEKDDGLAKALANNNTIAFCAIAETYQPDKEAIDKLREVLASSDAGDELALAENQNQLDLYYIKSVLVSTGWNKNDDVFDPKELWEARKTPEDKPFNFMHDEKDIIGHITANEVVDFDGTSISDDNENVPGRFNILTSAVIYTEWSDVEQKDRMQKIVAEIEEGKWFVSMECLFPDFDYALATENGETRVVKRNEASAFLTKHLRSYGGDGEYADRKVMAPHIEQRMLAQAPDTVLILCQAPPDVIRSRMKENPKKHGIVKEKDVDLVIQRFEEEYERSLIKNKFTVDTGTKTPSESLAEFVDKYEPYITDADRIKMLVHKAKKKGEWT